MRFASALLLIGVAASGMWFVRAYLLYERSRLAQNPLATRNDLAWFTGLTRAALSGIILVLGPALLLETARRGRSRQAWGIGRMTIAVTGLYVVLSFLEGVVGIVTDEYRRGSTGPSWAWQYAAEPLNWGNGLLADFPLTLAAACIVLRFCGRAAAGELDLQEVAGRCVAASMFAVLLVRILFE